MISHSISLKHLMFTN